MRSRGRPQPRSLHAAFAAVTVVACSSHQFQMVQADWPGTDDTRDRLERGARAVGCNVAREADDQVITCPEGALSKDADAGSIRIGPSLEGDSMMAMCENGLAEMCKDALARIWKEGEK